MSDLVDGLMRLMNTPDQVTGPINLGNPQELSVLALARKVIERTQSRSEIVQQTLPLDDPRQRRPDITLARRILGWEPKVALEEGLPATIDYFRSFVA